MGEYRPRAPFVGRAEELLRLEAALDATAAGRGSTVFLAGDAGIGKTRLAIELAGRASRRGARVHIGRCIPQVGAGLPYLPIIDALRPLPNPPALDRASGRSQLQLFDSVLTTINGQGDPAVLIVEDLHWADASTLDLLTYLARSAVELPLLIVGTLRSDEPVTEDPLPLLLAELTRAGWASLIHIGPFTEEDLAALLVGLPVPQPAPGDLVATIHARAEGNPFYAEELLAAAARGEQALPQQLREVLLLRLARLDAGTRAALRIVASAGREVPYRLISAVSPLTQSQLGRALRRAVEHRVVLFDQESASFRIRHALLAEAIYTTLLPGEREKIHLGLAHALTAEPQLAASGSVAAELAHHWTLAGRAGPALAASVHAARDAQAVFGLAEALRHVERVIELWPAVDHAQTTGELHPRGPDLAGALGWAAELCDLTGNGPRAVAYVRRQMQLADGADEPVGLGLLHERLGTYLLHCGDHAAALVSFRRAVALVPGRPPSAARARVLAALSNALMHPSSYDESMTVCREAIEVAQMAGDDSPALLAMSVLGRVSCCLGRTDEGIAQIHAARVRATELQVPHEITRAYVLLSDVLNTAGRFAEAIRIATEGIEVAHRLGLESGHGVALRVNAAEALLATGDWARAGSVLAVALRTAGAFWSQHPHLFQAQLDLGRGEFASAQRHLEAGAHGAASVHSAAHYACLVAELALWQSRPDDARTAVTAGLRTAPAKTAPHQFLSLWTLGLRADVELAQLAAVRRDDAHLMAVREHASSMVRTVRRMAADGVGVQPDARGWLALAEAEYGRVVAKDSPSLWQAAVTAWDELDRPYQAAYCRWRHAESLVAQRVLAAEAAVPAREAHRVTGWLGAAPMRAELERLARRARLDLVGLAPLPPSGSASPSTSSGNLLGLTAREHDVLELLGRGYTNRDIAVELTISAKTASVHVSNILRKLNASSRVEAATIAHRLAGPRVVNGARATPRP